MKKTDVCIIGAGKRAREAIFPALAQLPAVRLVGVCDLNPDAAKDAAQAYDIPHIYGKDGEDYLHMIEALKPQAVACIGQPHLLYDVYKNLLERGVGLFIEKPLGLTLHQAQSLAYLAKKNHCVTQVGLQRRYTPLVRLLRDKCLEKGPMVHAVCKFYKYEPQPFIGARDHLLDDTVHSIDTLRWICGGKVVGVKSFMKRVGTPDINYISATLEFESGATGYLMNSWTSGKREFSVEMHAPGIYARAEHEVEGYLYENGDVQGIRYDSKEVAGSDKLHDYTGVTATLGDFLDCVARGGESACSFENSLETMTILFKMLAQNTIQE